MIKDLPTMEVSMDTTQPKPSIVSKPKAIIRGTMDRRGGKKGKKKKNLNDRTQTKTLGINAPEPRNR